VAPDKVAVHAELARVRATFACHVAEMTPDDLRRPSVGTKWTNGQLLFHMLFGYLLVRRLTWLVKLLGRMPRRGTEPFAAALNSVTRPFDWINYAGSVGGAAVFTPERMRRRLDRVTAKLERDLDRQSEQSLARGMYNPTRWDPYFTEYMTLADIYHYPTQHFDHHDRQLAH
jgi:DinB superfamily